MNSSAFAHSQSATSFWNRPWLALCAPLLLGALSLFFYWLLPREEYAYFLREGTKGGLVEGATALLFFVAGLAAWGIRPTTADAPFRWRLSLLSLAFGAREMEWHKPIEGLNVMKGSFYTSSVPLPVKFAVFALLLLILYSALWAIWRGAPRVWRGVKARNPVACSVAVFFALILFAHVLDRTFNVTRETFGITLGEPIRAILAMEEPLELALPLIILLTLAQYRATRQIRD